MGKSVTMMKLLCCALLVSAAAATTCNAWFYINGRVSTTAHAGNPSGALGTQTCTTAGDNCLTYGYQMIQSGVTATVNIGQCAGGTTTTCDGLKTAAQANPLVSTPPGGWTCSLCNTNQCNTAPALGASGATKSASGLTLAVAFLALASLLFQ